MFVGDFLSFIEAPIKFWKTSFLSVYILSYFVSEFFFQNIEKSA